MFNFNDRNLVIVAISVLVIVYIILGKNPNDVGEIVEKAIIALGALTTGSILGGTKQTPKMTPKEEKKDDSN